MMLTGATPAAVGSHTMHLGNSGMAGVGNLTPVIQADSSSNSSGCHHRQISVSPGHPWEHLSGAGAHLPLPLHQVGAIVLAVLPAVLDMCSIVHA
jgi:hypothetical protein